MGFIGKMSTPKKNKQLKLCVELCLCKLALILHILPYIMTYQSLFNFKMLVDSKMTGFSLHVYFTGPWQVMLKQADGSYVCVAESATRFTLGEVSKLSCRPAIYFIINIDNLSHGWA